MEGVEMEEAVREVGDSEEGDLQSSSAMLFV